ncbi:MAG: GH3 auxin-responsive promoter family protein [Gammaproteobacteria bacterium]|nr:GH3 auxin-responsive promoter family protein [Gammaproteobacteria bacterium]MCP5139928.1 GH3 auxin-responsive promoter family protein [Chromatiales bacterium]
MKINKHWPQLVRDLHSGAICPDLNLPAGTRAALSPILRPNPARAETVARAFGHGLDAILQRLWPELRVLCSVTTGSFAATVPRLRALLGPDVSLFSGTYAASEAVIGVQLELDSEHYTLANGSAYFEFVPMADADAAQPTTVGPGDLELGHEYEVVVTTAAGLYRYRLGDVIRVTGRQGSTPRFTFSYRLGTVLDLLGEKTTEAQARQAIFAAAEQSLGSDAVVNGYALARSPQDIRSRYLAFIELWPDGGVTTAQLQTLAENIEHGLRHYNQTYWTLGGLRGRMEPVRLILLPVGSLDRIWRNDRGVHQSASSQWKARNLVSSDADIESLTRMAVWMGTAATSSIEVRTSHH